MTNFFVERTAVFTLRREMVEIASISLTFDQAALLLGKAAGSA